MIGRVDHVAIAVPDLAAATARYREALGARVSEPLALPEHGVTVAFVGGDGGEGGEGNDGSTKVELLEPLGEASPIAAFLARRPSGGMHHICYEVPDVEAAVRRLEATGARVLGPSRIGAHGVPVVFVDPRAFDGVLIELQAAR